MLNITVSSATPKADLLAMRVAIDALLMPEMTNELFESSRVGVSVHVDTKGAVRPISTLNVDARGASEPAAVNLPSGDSDPGDEQPAGTDADGKPKRTRRTKAQIEADTLAEAERIRLAKEAAAAPSHGTVSSADTAAPLNPPFQGSPQPEPAAPAPTAAANLFGDAFPAVAAPETKPATLGDLQGLVNDLLGIDATKGMAAAQQTAAALGVGTFKALDPSKYDEAAKMLRAAVSSLKVAA